MSKLENSDFFTAPASTMYHNAYEGGLCAHSLNVYSRLYKLLDNEYELTKNENKVDLNSILILGLLHDMSKMNFYETSERNAKDEKGNWIKIPFIKVKDVHDRFLFSNHELNSLYMVEQFIPLTAEESAAIANHMGGKSEDSAKTDITAIYNRYPLALFLHLADMMATFVDERI